MTTTVVGDPVRANARYFKKLDEIELPYHRQAPRRAGFAELSRIHEAAYLHRADDGFTEEWVGKRPDLINRAKESAGSSLRAATSVWRDDARKVFVPGAGHPHAGYETSDRMCVYNDIALAASWMQRRNWSVVVIDLDGLYAAPLVDLLKPVKNVTTISIHEKPVIPTINDTAKGVHNFTLHDYAGDYEMLQYVDAANQIILDVLPDVVLLNVGATGHESDELTALEYSLDGIYEAVVRISQTADELCGSRLIAFGGTASVGNEWASTISAAATHAISLPYLKSSAQRQVPRINTPAEEKTA